MKVLKFGAVWCAGCLVMKPRWKKLKRKYRLKTEYYDFDADKDMEKYNIDKTYPLLFFWW